jgi:phage terminase large subunit-like protein
MDSWDACKGDLPDLTTRECFAGLDLAATTDLTAFVLAFPVESRMILRPFFWLPRERLHDRVKRDRVPYDVWAKEGHIRLTEGAVTDYDAIRADILEIAEQYRIREIAVDRWNATQLATQLAGDGFEIIGFGQGFASMSGPAKELERRVLGSELLHDGHPVLRWMVSNVTVTQDPAGNIKPDKAKSKEKIDGVVAACMALGRYMVAEEDKPDIYQSRGLVFV